MDNTQTLNHLGGNVAIRLINARQFVASDNSLRFRFSGSRRINVAVVTLDADDTYSLSFHKVGKSTSKEVATFAGIYADDLQQVFENETGLFLSF